MCVAAHDWNSVDVTAGDVKRLMPPRQSRGAPAHASVPTLKNLQITASALSRAARARLILARISAPSAFHLRGLGSSLRLARQALMSRTNSLTDAVKATRADHVLGQGRRRSARPD